MLNYYNQYMVPFEQTYLMTVPAIETVQPIMGYSLLEQSVLFGDKKKGRKPRPKIKGSQNRAKKQKRQPGRRN